jgi:hypothetical protein
MLSTSSVSIVVVDIDHRSVRIGLILSDDNCEIVIRLGCNSHLHTMSLLSFRGGGIQFGLRSVHRSVHAHMCFKISNFNADVINV